MRENIFAQDCCVCLGHVPAGYGLCTKAVLEPFKQWDVIHEGCADRYAKCVNQILSPKTTDVKPDVKPKITEKSDKFLSLINF